MRRTSNCIRLQRLSSLRTMEAPCDEFCAANPRPLSPIATRISTRKRPPTPSPTPSIGRISATSTRNTPLPRRRPQREPSPRLRDGWLEWRHQSLRRMPRSLLPPPGRVVVPLCARSNSTPKTLRTWSSIIKR